MAVERGASPARLVRAPTLAAEGKDAKDAANEIAELHKKAEGLRGAVRDVETRVRRIHHLRH